MNKKLFKLIQKVAESEDWSVEFCEEDSQLLFSLNIPDFTYDGSFEVTLTTASALVQEVRVTAENFDADEETYLWLGPDGHGRNGAPYRLRDILNEMETFQERLLRLSRALADGLRGL